MPDPSSPPKRLGLLAAPRLPASRGAGNGEILLGLLDLLEVELDRRGAAED
jgi:hypothetical protein